MLLKHKSHEIDYLIIEFDVKLLLQLVTEHNKVI